MAPSLMTIEQMIRGVRTLMLDKIQPYRYSDISLIAALNIALNEGRRLRPDLFICRYGIDVPQFEVISGDAFPVESQFRMAFEFGIAGHALLRDEEDVQDQRASVYLANFEALLTGRRPQPMTGGTPTPSQAGSRNSQPGGQ